MLELTSRTRQVSEYTYHSIEAFTAASVLYAAITFVITVLLDEPTSALDPEMLTKCSMSWWSSLTIA